MDEILYGVVILFLLFGLYCTVQAFRDPKTNSKP